MSSETYQRAFKAYKECHSGLAVHTVQDQFNNIWRERVKFVKDKSEKEKNAGALLAEWREKATTKKSKNILQFFSKKNTDKMSSDGANLTAAPTAQASVNATNKVEGSSGTRKRKALVSSDGEEANSSNTSTLKLPSRHTPAQDKLKAEISVAQAELDLALRRRDSLSSSGDDQRKVLKLRNQVDQLQKQLRKKEQHARASVTYRHAVKSKIEVACNQNSDVANLLKTRTTPGRPRLEESQPELLKTIVDLAMFGASAEERRRSEALRSCRTLTDLHEKLNEQGFTISRSATYLRLLPKKYTTLEGKRHVQTVPVKLLRPEASRHKSHPDQDFCVATIRSLETVASVLGPEQVFFLSQDDKARVPIGLTAANKAAPLLMHIEYKVTLPDHDWVVASKHKLIPSVYAGCAIKPNNMGRAEAVTYSGPTYIAIRSGKHSSSTASTHALDFDKLTTLDSFKEIMLNNEGLLKPIVMISSDGGPDENPRYAKVISHAIKHFVKYDLDAIFIFTNAPGRSAFNRVERRMAPLSRELSGVILPHEHYGTHLDGQGRTIDIELERRNFKKAGDVLAEVWQDVVIDGHQVTAEYVDPEVAELEAPDLPGQNWYSEHVRESQYLLQVVKCDNRTCCGTLRSSIRSILPEYFLPPPHPLIQSPNGPFIPAPEDHDGKSFGSFLLRRSLTVAPAVSGPIAYDVYCPSFDRQQITERTCKECCLYFCSKKNLQNHRQMHRKTTEMRDTSCGNALACPSRVLATRRSTRLAQRERREVLCVMREDDDAEWQDEQEIEITDGIPESVDDSTTPNLINIEQNLTNLWGEN